MHVRVVIMVLHANHVLVELQLHVPIVEHAIKVSMAMVHVHVMPLSWELHAKVSSTLTSAIIRLLLKYC
jgi:hypothetical protein